MKIKRMLSAVLVFALVLGCFSGCGKENKEETGEALMPSISTTATGRYVEREFPLPACRYTKDMVMLSNGRLRLALQEESGNILLCTRAPGRIPGRRISCPRKSCPAAMWNP